MEVGSELARISAQYEVGYDLLHEVNKKDISTGELVLLHDDTVRPKLTNQWKGPYQVEEINRPNITITNIVGRPRDK